MGCACLPACRTTDSFSTAYSEEFETDDVASEPRGGGSGGGARVSRAASVRSRKEATIAEEDGLEEMEVGRWVEGGGEGGTSAGR